MTVLIGVLVVAALGSYIALILRKTGIGQPGGKPDCGCGQGSQCRSHVQQEEFNS